MTKEQIQIETTALYYLIRKYRLGMPEIAKAVDMNHNTFKLSHYPHYSCSRFKEEQIVKIKDHIRKMAQELLEFAG